MVAFFVGGLKHANDSAKSHAENRRATQAVTERTSLQARPCLISRFTNLNFIATTEIPASFRVVVNERVSFVRALQNKYCSAKKMTKHTKIGFVAILVLGCFFATPAKSAVSVVIQPSLSGDLTYFSVSWDSLDGAIQHAGSWEYSDPVTHSILGTTAIDAWVWLNFGDYKSSITNDAFFRTESPTFMVNSSGFGLYVDDDASRSRGDDFAVTFSRGLVPSSGAFVARTDTYQSGFSSMWNTGLHVASNGSSILVTEVAFIPEPSLPLLLLSGGSLAMLRRHRRNN